MTINKQPNKNRLPCQVAFVGEVVVCRCDWQPVCIDDYFSAPTTGEGKATETTAATAPPSKEEKKPGILYHLL